ncbi:MAG: DUF5818 domain-containing protein [Terracidiphilus sp.]|jgi:hypothetical protein
MQSLKRDFVHISAITALTLACALAWGSPIAAAAQAGTQDQAQHQPDQNQSKAATFTGMIVKNGDIYVLRDSPGAIYGLDDPDKAKPFEGKSVKVTGQLDEQAKVIHVQNIESAEG